MKKLLIALTAVAGLVGLAKAELAPGSLREEGFEGTAIPTTGWAKLDANDGSQITPWQTGEAPEVSEFPGAFSSFGYNYLGVSNADPLLALFGTMGATAPSPVDIGTGLFVDTYVKFSATETAPTPSNGVDKVIVWMYGSDTDSTTNLIVTAGYYDNNNISPCHYALDAVVEPDTWHRLTIKAMSVSETVATKIGFRVYIDGTEVAIKGKLVNGVVNEEDKSVGDSIYQGDVTEDLASEKLGQNRLFPSLIAVHSTLSCVGLEGWGAVDNFVLTTVDPIPDRAEEAEFTFTWDPEKFTAISYQVGTDPAVSLGTEELEDGTATLTLDPGAAVTFTCTPADGYMLGAFTKDGQCEVSGTTFTMNNPLRSSVASGELVANEVVAKIDTTPYASLADAIEAAGTSATTIELAKNISATNDGGDLWDAARIRIGSDLVNQNITIDLAGKTIAVSDVEGADVAALFVIAQGSTLTIIDSSDPSVGAVTSATAKIAENSGTLNITGGKFTGLIVNNGDATAPTITLTGGSFSDEGEEEGTFYLASVLEGTQYKATYAEGYWTVAEKLPSDFIVTAAPVENTTLEVTVDGEPVTVGENNTYTIPAGATATVTYTAAKHYTITANGVQEFTAAGTAVAPTLRAWLKYAADLYLGTDKLSVQAQLGTGDHFYDIGTEVVAEYAGVVTDPTFIGAGTYYISKIVDLENDKTVEFTYDGTTYAKVEADGALDVTLDDGNLLSYTVTTGEEATFAEVYFTKYEPPAPVGPSIGDNTYTDEVAFTNAVKAGATIELPKDAGWSFDGRTIKDGQGNVWATLPAYYTISNAGVVALDPVVTPVVNDEGANKGITVGTSGASINVTNPQVGLWYVLKRATEVGGSYAPIAKVQVTEAAKNIQLVDETIGIKAFYKVEVTDVEPTIPEVE